MRKACVLIQKKFKVAVLRKLNKFPQRQRSNSVLYQANLVEKWKEVLKIKQNSLS